MQQTIDLVRGELERLFSLDEMTTTSTLLGLDPEEVGGTRAKGSFAKALTERCIDGDRLGALVDVIVAQRREVDPRVREAASQQRDEELETGHRFGPFMVVRPLAESDIAVSYSAQRGESPFVLSVLRDEATRDKRAVHRYLTLQRLVATVDHPGLPKELEAGEIDGAFYVAYALRKGRSLAERFAKRGPAPIDELLPVLRAILEPLAALHRAQLTHGDLRLENVLVIEPPGGAPETTLVNFGADRLGLRQLGNGNQAPLRKAGSRGLSPELARGGVADPRSDVYAFGALVYELLTGTPVFSGESAADHAVAHLAMEPEPPSERAPLAEIPHAVDQFVLGLLAKDPAERPKDAQAVLSRLEDLADGGRSTEATLALPDEDFEPLAAAVLSSPADTHAALALEQAIEDGAPPERVVETLEGAAERARELYGDDAIEIQQGLLYRAARIVMTKVRDRETAARIYERLAALDPHDEIATQGLEDLWRQLGKFEQIAELLLGRADAAAPGEERARAYAEIGRLFASELEDEEQAVMAYARALAETPMVSEYASTIERLAGVQNDRWAEALDVLSEGANGDDLSTTERNELLGYTGRWYDGKLGRSDAALFAFQQVLTTDPADERANEGLTSVYRRSQQWPELASLLLTRAQAALSPPRARDLRAEAAEVFESKLGDEQRARDLFTMVLGDDPGHPTAGDGLVRIAERSGDLETVARLLEQRAEARYGTERADALARIGEMFESQRADPTEAVRRYENVLALDPSNLTALRGLDRIYAKTGRFHELLAVLERQLEASSTPRQKIGVLERVGALYADEFIDHTRAAESFEAILALDPSNEGALQSVVRHLRALERWEHAVDILGRHAAVVADEGRRIDLLVARARLLADKVGSPERAIRAYEDVLALTPNDPATLESLARLREGFGDAHAAVTAIEALAAQATTPDAKAELWGRAARVLEARGDRDGAIERYKLALDANPRDAGASAALRRAFADRGDGQSALGLIEKELATADGDLARARLLGEMARVYADKMDEPVKAELTAKRAIELDPTSADALTVLGDLSFEAGRYLEATRNYDSLVARADSLPKESAVRVLVRFIEAFGRSYAGSQAGEPEAKSSDTASGVRTVSSSHPRMVAAVEQLQKLVPDDLHALTRVARVIFEHGAPEIARGIYEELLEAHGDAMAPAERADALYRVGECARRSGDSDAALAALQDAAELDPSSPLPLQALSRVYEERGMYEAVVRLKVKQLDTAQESEQFDLLLEIGEIEATHLNDAARAVTTYAAALEKRPDDRRLLTKLMQLYSDERDWGKLVEVVQRLAEFVDDPKQRAKYMQTAAIVSHRQLGETDQALAFFERALEYDPTLTKALEEATELRRARGDVSGVERLLNLQLDGAKESGDRGQMIKALDDLGALYVGPMKEPGMAIDAYEAAEAFDPDNRERTEVLASLYASDVTRYLDKAVRAQTQLLRRNPYRVESYKLLRRLYTDAKRGDQAWCLCQALSVLNLAEPDEERFYLRHRSDAAAPAQAVLDETDWSLLAHPDLDPVLTSTFAMIERTIIRARTQPVEALGYDPAYALNTEANPYPVAQTIHYAHGVFGGHAPLVFQNPNDPAGLGFLHAHTPAIVLGRAAFDAQVPMQPMAFVAARHLAYFRPGFYVRHLVPTGTGLKAWLFAAIKLVVPQFPIAPDLQGQANEAMAEMQADFRGVEREKLASVVSKLLKGGGALDLKKWVEAIDLSADRAGLLLAHDLSHATDVIRATEEGSSVPAKERIKEAVLFSVSEEYFALRDKLGIRIDS